MQKMFIIISSAKRTQIRPNAKEVKRRKENLLKMIHALQEQHIKIECSIKADNYWAYFV